MYHTNWHVWGVALWLGALICVTLSWMLSYQEGDSKLLSYRNTPCGGTASFKLRTVVC